MQSLFDNNIVDYNSLIHPDDRDLVRKAVDGGLSSQMHYVVDYRIITKDGVVKYVWERGHALLDNNGEFYMLQGFITDITDRKIAEDTLQRQNQDLEAQYEEYLQLNEMLRRTNYELEIAKATKEQKEQLISRITTEASEVLGLAPETFYVLIKENEIDNWGVGGKVLSKYLAEKNILEN